MSCPFFFLFSSSTFYSQCWHFSHSLFFRFSWGNFQLFHSSSKPRLSLQRTSRKSHSTNELRPPCFGKSLILFKQQWKHRHCELDEYTRGKKKFPRFFLVVIRARPLRQGWNNTTFSQLTDDDDDCCCWTVAEANEPLEWVFEWRARGRRGIKTENYFFFVPFGLKLISTVRERSRVLGRGWNSRSVGFSFRFSACIFYYTLSGSLSLDDDDDEKWKETSEHFPSPLLVAFWTVGQSSSGGIVWMES